MRIKKSMNNAMFSSANMLLNLALTFIYRTIFIQTLGVDYLGLNALYTNILMMLSLAELGVGQAIAFSLYKPLSSNDTAKINLLIGFYKKVYRYIGCGVLVFGFLVMPFIPSLISTTDNLQDIYLIFVLFLLNSSITYFWGYKRILIIADQNEFKLIPYLALSQIVDNSLRIYCLIITQSFVFALVIQLVVKLLENIFINQYIDRQYQYLTTRIGKINKDELSVISTNVKAMVLHKLGDFFVNGTDNIIISSFIGISILGIYSNYTMLVGVIISFLMLIFNATCASLGNMIVKESIERTEQLFGMINFLAYWLFGWVSISFYILIEPFIVFWLGDDFVLEDTIVLLLSINLFVFGTRVSLGVIKSAGGIYAQDKYSPLIQGFINLLISIVLVQMIGLKGVLIGTLISSLLVPSWHRPYIVYKHLFKSSPRRYFYKLFIFSIILLLSAIITKGAVDTFTSELNSGLSNFIIAIGICFIIPNVLIAFFYYRASECTLLYLYVKPYMLKAAKWKN